jgi:two-component system CheB/CheR fusion protein
MYFNAETQARVLGRLHFALRDDGVLFLGRSELLLAQDGLFRPIEPAQRTFVKVDKPRAARGGSRIASAVNGGDDGRGEAALRDSALDASSVAEVIVDADGAVWVINERAAETFALGAPDVGRPLQDLELSYRPVDLRSNLQEAYSERHGVLLSGVRYGGADDQERVFDVRITPLYDQGALLGASIAYTDVTAADALRDDLQRSKAELENAYDELQATVEELETTNEELQSTNEVLETTNEELQSTNGALETINEELRAANEDLETTNDELRLRRLELKEADAFVQTILTGMGVVVVDRDERIQVFNTRAEDLSGARFDDVHGRPLESVDTGLPVERLRIGIRAALAGQQQRGDEVLDATGGRGRVVRCRVSFLPLTLDAERAPSGAVVLMKEISTGDARQGDDGPDRAPAA